VTGRQQWNAVEAALDEILALPESEWSEACARIAGDDDALRAEITSLLECAGGVDPVLDHPLTASARLVAAGTGLPSNTRVGAYRILELIGRGGMGEVYRAERADGQYQQQVALKLIRGDLADHPERFQVERQILAQLDHPGIARLLDGGMFRDTLPYMVIELVKGLPITEWCRRAGSDLIARLSLFTAVCDAVAHAHRNLVIHRDIKPGNVLVTDEGAVKLLDFGVAKLLSAAGDATRDAPMTPGYSAPEQLTGGPITTGTDVFALGILLFELLCGELPWRSDGLPFGGAVRRMLNETAPTASRRARAAGSSPVPWQLLRGDLDAILAKALRKEPEHRYGTVNELREDVARVLRHEPVAAREGARLYVMGRFVRRQRILVASAGALLIVVIVGSLAVAWQAREALHQARRAELEGRKATAVKDFLLDIFKQASVQNPGGVEARRATAEQLLDVGATRIKTQLRDQPDVREELMDTLAELNNDLGLTDRAKSLASDNLAELQRRTDGRPSATSAKLEVRLATSEIDRSENGDARSLLNRALKDLRAAGEDQSVAAAAVYFQLARSAYDAPTNEKAGGLRDLHTALDILRLHAPTDPLQGEVLDYLARYAQLADDYPTAERWADALLSFQTAQGIESNKFAIGHAQLILGDLQSLMRRYGDGERNLRRAVQLLSEAAGPTHPEAAEAQARLGELLFYMGHRADAAALLNEALRAQLLTPQGVDDATETRKTLAVLEIRRGRLREAGQLLRDNLAQLKGRPEKELRYGVSASYLAMVLAAQGQFVEARNLYELSRDIYGRYRGERTLAYARVLMRGGAVALASEKSDEAAAIFERVIGEEQIAKVGMMDDYAGAVLGLAEANLDLGRTEAARSAAEELLQRILGSGHPDELIEQEAQARSLFGEALRRAGRIAEAEPHLRRAVELRSALDDADSPWLARARIDLAKCLAANHETGEARSLIALAAAAQARQPQLSERYRHELKQAQNLLRNAS
jgi:hypothetical protein